MSEREEKIRCPLCGYRFKSEEADCAGCFFADTCRLTRCPNCGYHFPLSSKLATLFRIRKKDENDRSGT
jgi:C4-type Zn-finger protein